MDLPPDIAFAAYTDACTFMLDKKGICRWVVAASARRAGNAHAHQAAGPLPPHAERCIGAQYVASIALGAKGGLIELPKPGAPLLFARIEPNGRIALVRTGPLVRFEEKADSGVRPAPRESTPPNLPEDVLDSFMARLPVCDDDEMTTPYTPSNGVMAVSRPSKAPQRHSPNARTQERESVQPARITTPSEQPRGEPRAMLPRIPAPPRMPLISERFDDGYDDDPQSEGPTIPIRRTTRLPPAPVAPRPAAAAPRAGLAPLPARASSAPPRYTPAPFAPSFRDTPLRDTPPPVAHRPSAVVSRRPSLVRVSAPNWDAVDALPRTRRAR